MKDHQDQQYPLYQLGKEEKNSLQDSLRCSIHIVPKNIRRSLGDENCKPQVVSIGPFHRDEKDLEVTVSQKKLYMHSLISRNTTPSSLLPLMVKEITKLHGEARMCYAERIDLSEEEFVRMMILDGCFILEVFYRFQWKEQWGLSATDILFSKPWVMPCLRRDLVLLENQIPFCVLRSLFLLTRFPFPIQTTDATIPKLKFLTQPKNLSLNELIANFFDPILPTTQKAEIDISIEGKHLLDLLRAYLLYHNETSLDVGDYMPSATDLQKAGVKFRRKGAKSGLLDISFNKGTLEVPPFYFGKLWTVLLLNIIALEQCHRELGGEIAAYVLFMNSLISCHEDVKLLRDNGIIIGSSKQDEKTLQVIKSLCQEVSCETYYVDGICSQVNAYSRSTRNKWKASLKHTLLKKICWG